jgi:hypothetical protein
LFASATKSDISQKDSAAQRECKWTPHIEHSLSVWMPRPGQIWCPHLYTSQWLGDGNFSTPVIFDGVIMTAASKTKKYHT